MQRYYSGKGYMDMKKTALMIVLLTGFPGIASAQERQVYSPYPTPTFTQEVVREVQQEQAQVQQVGTRRIYPGREAYGRNFGPIPRHPGDYRDAVDRGSWTGQTSGSRSFSID